jgi:hypothetical protein
MVRLSGRPPVRIDLTNRGTGEVDHGGLWGSIRRPRPRHAGAIPLVTRP